MGLPQNTKRGNLFSLLRLGSVRFVLRSPREKCGAEPVDGPLSGEQKWQKSGGFLTILFLQVLEVVPMSQ